MPHGDEFGDALPVGSAAASKVQRRAYLGAILAIVVVALAATLLVLDQRRQVTQALTSSTQNLASSLEQTMDGMIDTVDIALQSSADEIFHLRTGHRLPSDEVTAYLTRQAQRLPLVAYLRATDETGRVLYGPGVPASAVSLADREFFQHLRATPNAGLYVSKPLVGRIAQRTT